MTTIVSLPASLHIPKGISREAHLRCSGAARGGSTRLLVLLLNLPGDLCFSFLPDVLPLLLTYPLVGRIEVLQLAQLVHLIPLLIGGDFLQESQAILGIGKQEVWLDFLLAEMAGAIQLCSFETRNGPLAFASWREPFQGLPEGVAVKPQFRRTSLMGTEEIQCVPCWKQIQQIKK